jgi:hypothetical protein
VVTPDSGNFTERVPYNLESRLPVFYAGLAEAVCSSAKDTKNLSCNQKGPVIAGQQVKETLKYKNEARFLNYYI